MKVGLIFFHSFLQPGGIRNHVLNLSQELKKKGVSVKIIAPRREKSEHYGKDIILLGTSFPIKFGGSQADFCINFNPLAIKKVLQKERFDILHFHNFSFPSSMQILKYADTTKILTIHANLDGSKLMKTFQSSLVILNKIIKNSFDGIIGVAPLTLKGLEKYAGPKAVIPNGINLGEFNPGIPKIKKFLDGRINLLFVGRIEKRKGLIYLLKAYRDLSKKFSNLRLIIVGEGGLKENCRQWAKKNNLREVYFEGEISQKHLPAYFSTADIFVSPAIFGESFGMVLLEAMASGVPVAAFANQGYKELLKGEKGEMFLAPPKNCQALAKKIEVLVKDDVLRKSMGEWGRKEAQKYAWPKIADQILAFYNEAARRPIY